MAIAVIVGGLSAWQARINGDLGQELDNGYLAGLIALVTGLIVISIAMAVSPSGRRGLRLVNTAIRTGTMPWWYTMAGAAGALLVLSQGITASLLGVALFTVAIVSGQTISGLIIDRNGFGSMAPTPVTYTRLIGSALTLVAVSWAVSAQMVGDIPIWLIVLPFAAGLALGWQLAANGQVRLAGDSALAATFINFVVGTVLLVIAAIINVAFVGWPEQWPTNPLLYAGGLIGVLFIAVATVLVRITGVLLLGLGTIAGQLLASLLLDIVAPVAGHVIAWTTVAGTILTLLAVALAVVPSRPIKGLSRTRSHRSAL